MPDETQQPPAPQGAATKSTAPAQPPAPQGADKPADALGPQLTEAKARITQLVGEKAELEGALEKSKRETLDQKEEVARLQGLLTKLAKSQLPELGEGAFEVGEGATILASTDTTSPPGRVHALIGDVLAVGFKPAAFSKLKEKVAGKARVFAVDKATIDELHELKLLRA